jgi:hypothetical protein
MSKLVKQVIGEAADFGPDEFMAGDEGAGPVPPAGPGAGHVQPVGGGGGGDDHFDAEDFMAGDEGAGGPDEKREVQIGTHIMFAAQNMDMHTIVKLAQELIDMHSKGAGGAAGGDDHFDAEDFMGGAAPKV